MAVIVFNRLAVPGWAGNDPCDVPQHACMPLKDALSITTPQERLIAAYGRSDGSPLPRLLKSAVARFPRDPNVALHAILVDVDYEDHQVPPEGWADEIVAKVAEGFQECGWYRTPHGMRLVWDLAEPVPLIEADSVIRWVHNRLNEVGVATDVGTSDWTRMQRLPFAKGLDLPHSDFDDIPTLVVPDEAREESTPRSMGPFIARARPASVDKVTRSDLSEIKKVDARLADALYAGNLAAPEGERHSTLLSAALTITHTMKTNDPYIPYRLLLASAEEMGKDEEELWRICEWAAAAQAGAEQEIKAQKRENTRQSAHALGISPMVLLGQLILDNGKEMYVWDEDLKEYCGPILNQRQLLSALKDHCPILAGDIIYEGKGVPEILRDHSAHLRNVVYCHWAERTHFDARRGELLVPSARPDPTLKPVFSKEVEGWLQRFFGQEHYDDGLKWLAAFPRLDRPVCALYLCGEKSIGKGLFAKGLARIYSPHCEYADYAEVTGDFQAKMLSSPLIYADEKVPQDAFKANDSSVFRRLVGNGSHTINQKHQSPVTLRGFPRVLITANNDDALSIREDLDSADLDAVRIRIGYIDRGKDTSASEYMVDLAEEKGYENTYDLTEPWVTRDIAQHVLWLAENYKFRPDSRFLVEGWHSSFTDHLVTSVGAAGAIAETLVLAVERGLYTDSIRWFDGRVMVNATKLAMEWEQIRGQNIDRCPQTGSRTKALKSLAEGQQIRLKDSTDSVIRYWSIPATVLAGVADRYNIMDYSEFMLACSRRATDERMGTMAKESAAGKILSMKP